MLPFPRDGEVQGNTLPSAVVGKLQADAYLPGVNIEFWSRHPGLVWSNSFAGDEVRIRAALLAPRFHQLLDVATVFGLERLQAEWAILEVEGRPETRRAAPHVERILHHIGIGFAYAQT